MEWLFPVAILAAVAAGSLAFRGLTGGAGDEPLSLGEAFELLESSGYDVVDVQMLRFNEGRLGRLATEWSGAVFDESSGHAHWGMEPKFPFFTAKDAEGREVEGYVRVDGTIFVFGDSRGQIDLDAKVKEMGDRRTLDLLHEPENKDLDTGERRALRERVEREIRDELKGQATRHHPTLECPAM